MIHADLLRRPGHRARAGGLALLLGALLAVAMVLPALAHASLVSTSPADGSTVGATPDQVVLTFNEPLIGLGTELRVTGPSGDVAQGEATVVDKEVRQALAPGAPAGAYTVDWRVTSADGHPISGSFTFTSAEAGTGTASTAAGGSDAAAPSTAETGAGGGSSTTLVIVLVGLIALVVVGLVAMLRRSDTSS